METRLTEIEIKLTQMEDLLDALNLTVYRQQEMIARLQQQQQVLVQQMHDMSQSGQRTPSDETPPHY
jgi:SlyX protein